ncbi:MAG: hypothetical protein A2X64_05300 [Ignavibacteria bacterium GWF2_33_9]|nr:MAG: hypothetical protein A2X64_05300 [Ignavibacteria bacterium GWF2_33_9]
MKKINYLILFVFLLQSCQLIVLNPDKQKKVVYIANQNSALGILNLYLLQLDSNDVYSAIFLRTDSLGNRITPAMQYEDYYDVFRLQRQISGLPITQIITDTLSQESIVMNVEFDYIRKVEFLATKLDDKWYISDLRSWKEIYR